MAHHAGRLDRIAWVEEPLEYPAGEAFLVSGRLELACHTGGGIEIIDYKVRTARRLEDLKPRYQLDTYALAAAHTFGADIERLVIHLLAEAPGKELVSWQWNGEVARAARERVARAAVGIAARRFEATPGPHCRYCDFKAICPVSQARDWKPAETMGAAP